MVAQHLRKAHPKAERFGGTKKVQGLKSDQKDTVTMKGNKVQKVSSEDLSLLARLDELEEKETKNAELDQVGKDDSGDEKSITTGEHTNIQGDARWGLHHKEKTNETKKKVTWEIHDVKDETVVSSTDSTTSEDDDENHDSDDLQTTISVKFSSSSEHSQGKVSISFYCTVLMFKYLLSLSFQRSKFQFSTLSCTFIQFLALSIVLNLTVCTT